MIDVASRRADSADSGELIKHVLFVKFVCLEIFGTQIGQGDAFTQNSREAGHERLAQHLRRQQRFLAAVLGGLVQHPRCHAQQVRFGRGGV